MATIDFENNEELKKLPFITAQKILADYWIVSILLELSEKPKRFSELRLKLDISETLLTNNLKFLKSEGLIHREFFAEVPPRVEYSLTEIGKKFLPLIDNVKKFGESYYNYINSQEQKISGNNISDEKSLLKLLREYKSGKVSENDALNLLKNISLSSVENLGFASIDHARELRQGFPEVVYAAGKTKEQLRAIFKSLYEKSTGNLIATRADSEKYQFLLDAVPTAKFDEISKMIYVDRKQIERRADKKILILSAGTSDMPVAEEARLTAYLWGNYVETAYDCGVAGIHRLFAHMKEIETANVIIVVAGMEGALASVVGGLTDKPVIAVPTSIGYGAAFNGIAALLAMLNSCAAGVSVVNIDNGFGAGVLAAKINKLGG